MKQKHIGILIIVIALATLVLLILVNSDLGKRDAILCEVTHTNPMFNINECPAHTSNTYWFITLAFVLASLALAIGVYLFIVKTTEAQSHERSFKRIELSKLDDNEKRVYEIVKESNGSVYQSDIVKQLGFSKVKTTRLLDKMEQKSIIERKRRGMTNIIVLK